MSTPELSHSQIEVLFRTWWGQSYPVPPGVHAINTHVGFAAWLLTETTAPIHPSAS